MRFPTKTEFFAGLGIVALVTFFVGRGCQKRRDLLNQATTLAPDVREKIIVNPKKHSLTTITRLGVTTTTLPDRPSSIEIMNNGKVKVNSPQFGTELNPFVGVAYALHGGVVGGGVDVLYWKRLDLGLGLMINPVFIQETSIFVGISYLTYSNTSIGIGLDNHQVPMLLVKLRI